MSLACHIWYCKIAQGFRWKNVLVKSEVLTNTMILPLQILHMSVIPLIDLKSILLNSIYKLLSWSPKLLKFTQYQLH